MLAGVQWQEVLGYAGALLMLVALFLHLFVPLGEGRGRWRAVLGLFGAAALLPSVLLHFKIGRAHV